LLSLSLTFFQIARVAVRLFLDQTDAQLTLYLRNARRLKEIGHQARGIVVAMREAGVKRLIFISSMGIYGEVPGERYRSILDPYRDSARVIEDSDLDYTIIRPEWLNDRDEIDYDVTQKGEPFKNPARIFLRLADCSERS
jgi:hypothetical protein